MTMMTMTDWARILDDLMILMILDDEVDDYRNIDEI